ncbi:hypothetical protein Tsp_15314, partial [Trichinella spiralis]|uniref:hypothetical protein n=1 Tax=Trichinella spiralis TaxID=6334 RepID=UPI0001EFE655
MPRCNLLSVKTGKSCLTVITSLAEFLWCSFCSGQRDKSCSHHFVLNLASQTSISIEFHMDIKAFPSRPSVPLLITNSILEDASVTWIELDNIYNDRRTLDNIYNERIIVFNVLVRNCEDESRILNDLHRITDMFIKSSRERKVLVRSIK